MDFLAFLRMMVLGPLVLQSTGARPQGVRKIESAAPPLADRLRATIAQHDAPSCVRALEAAVALYRELRPKSVVSGAAEDVATEYLDATMRTVLRQRK